MSETNDRRIPGARAPLACLGEVLLVMGEMMILGVCSGRGWPTWLVLLAAGLWALGIPGLFIYLNRKVRESSETKTDEEPPAGGEGQGKA